MDGRDHAHPSEQPFMAGDAMRALAICAVFVFHAAFGAALTGGASPGFTGDTIADFNGAFHVLDVPMQALPAAVYVFLALSGYLLSRRFIRAYVEGTPMPSARNFLRNRVLRIVPAFWFVAAITVARYGVAGSTPSELLAIPAFLQLYIDGPITRYIEHAWTVDTEWGLYLGLPLAATLVARTVGRQPSSRRRRLTIILCGLGVLTIASLAVRALGPQTTQMQRVLPSIAWAFMPGVGLAAIEVAVAGRVSAASWVPRMAVAVVTTGLGLLLLAATLSPDRPLLRATLNLTAVTLVLGGPLLLQWSQGRCWRVLASRPLRWLGERSYSFYLLHGLVGFEIVGRLGHRFGPVEQLIVLGPPMFIGTCFLAALSYRFVEQPFLRLKRRQTGATTDGVNPVGLVAVGGQGQRVGSA